jgi:hypothetical protein
MYRLAIFVLVLGMVAAGCGDSPALPDAIAIDGTGPVHVDDGTPTRRPCTEQLGNALSTAFGRLDGILVAIVPPGGSACNADADHVHLQIQANGAVYDVAINVGTSGNVQDVKTTTRDIPLPGTAWSEGWHTGFSIDYAAMNVHAADLTLETRAQHVSDLMTELATVNHVSVFATGYGPDGVHLVHRNDFGHDGLVVTKPLSTPAHARLFSFTAQSF